MKVYEVSFRPRAEADLIELYDYIAEEFGLAAALRYVDRIEAACNGLARFPHRGRARHDLRPGLRVMGFERRAVIAFVVGEDEVVIARVLHGGRDYDTLLSKPTED